MNQETNTALPADLEIGTAFSPAAQPRRVLVYAPLAYSTPHFETDLEIAQRHLDLGDHVDLILCDADLGSCQLNPHHDLHRCLQCVSRNLQGAAQLSSKTPVLDLPSHLTPEDRASLARIPKVFPDQAALRRYVFEGLDAGMAALSSVIDFARSPDIDTQQLAALIHRTVHAAATTFLAMRRVLAAQRYDCVYIYNGRWSMMRSAIRACEMAGVTFYTHERGSDFRKFALYRNVLPHDKDNFRSRVSAAWDAARALPQAQAVAEAFFQGRRQRVEKTWFSFVKQQETGRLPADWDRGARRLVFFTSSEFEYAAIGEGTLGRIYPSQALAAPRIAQLVAAASPETHLWIRVHPNDNTPETARKWQKSTAGVPNITLILPDAKIDSYALLDGADRVLTFGSTVGIEAAYWGKPAVCADFSFYNGLDAQYEAANEAKLVELLTRPGLPPKPRENALCFGYYLNTYGGNFIHFSTDKISDYEFKSPFRGHCLKPDYQDLRQRLLALYQENNFVRSAKIARLCAQANPEDGLSHSIHILSLLRSGMMDPAVAALEETAVKASVNQLAEVLKSTAKPLFEAAMPLPSPPPGSGESAATRIGRVMLRIPAFAPIGQKLIALASRPRGAPPPATVRIPA